MTARIHRIYRPFQIYFRTRRMRRFAELFQPASTTRIIDVGGVELNWTLIDASPQVLLVNVETDNVVQRAGLAKATGDGRALDYPDNAFDIAYSNSVLEHVGTEDDQRAFADEIRRVAPRYYVQTPNREFVVEPHLMAVALHFLPRAAMRKLVRWLSVWGWVERPTQARVDEVLDSIHLVDARLLHTLFPDAEIMAEKFLGMTKSLIAIRR